MKRVLLGIMTGLLACALAGCLESVTEAPLEIPGEGIEAPRDLSARAGDGTITLEWRSVETAGAYRIYRSVDSADRFQRIGEIADTTYLDRDVQNGRLYYYAVSAISAEKLEGKRSVEIVASPAVYGVTINGGDVSTRSTSVMLTFTAPATTENVMVASDSSLFGDVWGHYETPRVWTLETGDGVKRVFVKFRDRSDVVSPVVSAAITLDTYAMIESVAISPTPYRYSPGSTVHFAMVVEDDEREGEASVSIEGYSGAVSLRDDGRGGDTGADDGVYEVDYRLLESIRGTELVVTGNFIDRTGNSALPFECPTPISITDPPDAVQLIGAVDSTRTSITIRWTASENPHFLSYRIYRNTSAVVQETPAQLAAELFNPEQMSYADNGLKEGVRYYYRIFVVNDLGETAGSNTVSVRTFDAYPDPVLLDEPSSVGANRVTLTWSENTDTDFREYRLYRSLEPGVTLASTLVSTLTNREQTYFDDTGLDLSSNTYYYRVYIFDLGGKSSRSNEVDTAP